MLKGKNGSDLYIAAGAAPSMKIDGKMTPVSNQKLSPTHTRSLARSIMSDKQATEFDETNECNFAISLPGVSRFRINAYIQRGSASLVIRLITAEVPKFADLKLPPILKDVTMTKRGLVIMVGGTGSGKSTTLAAMIDYRDENSYGHIISIEDPIEFVHKHLGCIVSQREVGTDTASFDVALKNALRQAPDVILIGEIRDVEIMEQAIAFAETGHLCLATLHANSTNQAMDRILNFFPDERREQLLMDLSLNIRAIVSQRLLKIKKGKGRIAAIEVLLNSPLMSDLILKGDIHEMKSLMAKSNELGMITFDQALFNLIKNNEITMDEGFRSADSINDLRLRLKLETGGGGDDVDLTGGLDLSLEAKSQEDDQEDDPKDNQ
jgi:twitching motility protein PilU